MSDLMSSFGKADMIYAIDTNKVKSAAAGYRQRQEFGS